jgi:hypothetical protein
MKKIIFILIFVLFQSYCFTQSLMFQRKYFVGGYLSFGTDIILTNDSGYALIGGSNYQGGGGMLLIKLKSDGDTLWSKIFDQMAGDHIKQCSDGGFIIIGFSYTDSTYYDISIMKTNAAGDTLWVKKYKDLGWTGPEAVSETSDGGYIVAGGKGYSADANDPHDLLIMKINSLGDTIWAKRYGGNNDEFVNNMVRTNDGGFILVGGTNSFGNGDYDILLTQIDSSGNLLWSKAYGGALEDAGMDILQTSDGGYIVDGVTKNFGAGAYSTLLMKVDSSGNIQWARNYGESIDYQLTALAQNSNKEIIIVGIQGVFTSSDRHGCVIKTDSSGSIIWSKKYSPSNDLGSFSNIIVTPDNGFLQIGSSGNSSTGIFNAYLVKTDSSGNSGCNQEDITPIITDITSQMQSGTSSITLQQSLGAGLYIENPRPIIYQGVTVNTLCYSGVGIEEESVSEEMQIKIFPNPASSLITVMYNIVDESTENVFCIFDIMGDKIEERKLSKNEGQVVINTENYLDGVYFCTFISDGVATDKIKLVVIK